MKVENTTWYRTCPTCNGSGRIGIKTMFDKAMVCPACKGAGAFEVAIPPEKILTCKNCNGDGILKPTVHILGQKPDLFPVCKGRGFIK